MQASRFSPRTLGLFAQVAPEYFTHTGLETVLLTHGVVTDAVAANVNKQQVLLNAIRTIRDLPPQARDEALSGLLSEVLVRMTLQNSSDWNDRERALLDSVVSDGWVFDDQRLTWKENSRAGTSDTRGAATDRPPHPVIITAASDYAASNRIFIVHGRDIAAKDSVARLVDRLGFDPIVLHERENRGRTILEKFLAEAADAAFAIVLLTSDDYGNLQGATPLNPRARQNVVLEFGYFVGLLGRSRVVALVSDGVELPSDLQGLLYVRFSPSADDWKMELAREMRAAGLAIDLNRL